MKSVLFALGLLTNYAVNAIDYPGGWVPGTPKNQCVDICVNSKPTPSCFTNQTDCLAKKQAPGDFDYMLLEELYVPQFCRDLLQGVDTTVSHQNVNPFPNGIQCKFPTNQMTIHGLWPNYNDGYPACCNVSSSIANHPFHAAQFAANHPALLTEMSTKWIDPTQDSAYDTLCEIYNHEFQKHGLCYAAFGDDYEKAAVVYFEATLQVARHVRTASDQINQWASAKTPEIPSLAALEALYSHKVQVFCSGVDGVNRLSAIRSCFEKPADLHGPFKQIDCAPAKPMQAFALCDPSHPIALPGYSPLSAIS